MRRRAANSYASTYIIQEVCGNRGNASEIVTDWNVFLYVFFINLNILNNKDNAIVKQNRWRGRKRFKFQVFGEI